MPFVVKDWRNANSSTGGGDISTPVTAEAFEDLETRVTDYTDEVASSVMAHGATGDGVTDDTTAIHAARDASGDGRVFFPAGTYLTTGLTASVDDQRWELSPGATIKLANSAAAYVSGVAITGTNVTVAGGKIDGNKAGQTNDQFGVLISASGAKVLDMEIAGMTSMAIATSGSVSDIQIEGNTITDPDFTGVWVAGPATRVTVRDNYISGANQGATTGHGGIMTYQDVADIKIVDNYVYDSIKTGIGSGAATLGTRILIQGNTVDTTTGADSTEGIAITACEVQVLDNVVRNTYVTGILIYCTTGVRDIRVAGNMVSDVSQDGAAAHSAIIVEAVSGSAWAIAVQDNLVFDVAGSTTARICRIQDSGGSLAGITVTDNVGYGLVSSDGVVVDADFLTETRVTGSYGNTIPTVASATTTTLPALGDLFYVSGTTAITSITAAFPGRRVTLRFTGSLTFTDGSNLILAGNFSTAVNSTITLACDGTYWYEMSRSAN